VETSAQPPLPASPAQRCGALPGNTEQLTPLRSSTGEAPRPSASAQPSSSAPGLCCNPPPWRLAALTHWCPRQGRASSRPAGRVPRTASARVPHLLTQPSASARTPARGGKNACSARVKELPPTRQWHCPQQDPAPGPLIASRKSDHTSGVLNQKSDSNERKTKI